MFTTEHSRAILFFGPLVERIEIAEVVKRSTILIGLRGRFTQSVCKMWVRIRRLRMGSCHRVPCVTIQHMEHEQCLLSGGELRNDLRLHGGGFPANL